MKNWATILLIGISLLSSSVSAGLFIEPGKTSEITQFSSIASNFDSAVVDETKIFGWVGANVLFDNNDQGNYKVAWNFINAESGYDNALFGLKNPNGNFDNNNFATNPNSGPNLIFSEHGQIIREGDKNKDGQVNHNYQHNSGEAVPFAFSSNCSNKKCKQTNRTKNGDNNDHTNSWFVGFKGDDIYHLDLSTIYLLFNDNGSSDADYDDLIVTATYAGSKQFTTVSIPEPSTLFIFMLSLLSIMLYRRKNV